MQDTNKECSKLKKKLYESLAQRRTSEEQNTKKDKRTHEFQSQTRRSDENARKQVDHVKGFRCICIGMYQYRDVFV